MSKGRGRHNAYQRRVFRESLECFLQPVPPEVEGRTQEIVAAAGLSPRDRVLDVGAGTGVLIPHIRRYGVRRIVACDLSPVMLAQLERAYPRVRIWCGDVVDLPVALGPFDAVFFNAMFGNVWDQRLTLEAAVARLSARGRVIISHPMGAGFVEALRRRDPRMVPHPLPDAGRLTALIQGLPLVRRRFEDAPSLYLCVLEHGRNTVPPGQGSGRTA